ncbi:MAG TPA: class I SAM-dependent methyltransferase [Pyrinomonadaceae bacterium]|jgi:SAM-dependent methyltransferase
MTDTIDRFSNRVENYVKYRPGYPPEMLEAFRAEMNLNEKSAIADIGSGTGISAKIFLENGNRVFGVEPNRAMRDAAEEFLKDYPNFTSVEGTAENTNLPDDAVDLVVAAQAFHWFDRQKTPSEFRRIARAGAFVALVWNERQLNANEFLRAYEEILKKYGTDYEKVRHDNLDKAIFEEAFQTDFSMKTFENAQSLDFDGMRGRILSSSYTPPETDPRFAPMENELRRLFEKYAERGKIQILYNTNIFYTRL